jgi:hypothetical protein
MDVVITALIHGIGKINKAMKIAIKDPVYAVRLIKGIRRHGIKWALDKSKGRLFAESLTRGYSYDEEEHLDTDAMLKGLARKPIISVVMPVYNVETRWLDEAVRSVLSSTYDNYELIIVDDCSKDNRVTKYLGSLSDSRVKVARNVENLGISGTSNRGVEEASGEYIVMMDNDDLIHRNALLHIAAAIVESEPDVIYSDEDKTDQDGIRKAPFYKPDWSPDLLRSQMYIGHIFAFRKEFFIETGGFREEFDGAQDYDLALRMSELTSRICHIQRVLYSWRELPSSTAMNPDSKPYAHTAGLKALDGHLKRVFGQGAFADETDQWYVYDARYPIILENPLVSLIINQNPGCEIAIDLLAGIADSKGKLECEVILPKNLSIDSKALEALKSSKVEIKQVDIAAESSWIERMRSGAGAAKGEILIFVDGSANVTTKGWITRLAENALRPGTGFVGALIEDEKGVILSAGLTIDRNGGVVELFKGAPTVHFGTPFTSPIVTRNVMGVSSILMAASRETFDKSSGFSEVLGRLETSLRICEKCYDSGLFNIYDPFVKVVVKQVECCVEEYMDQTRSKASKLSDPYTNRNLLIDAGLPRITIQQDKFL